MSKERPTRAITKADTQFFADFVKTICTMSNNIEVSSICLACQKYRIYPFICELGLDSVDVSRQYEKVIYQATPLIKICPSFISNLPPKPGTGHELVDRALQQRN